MKNFNSQLKIFEVGAFKIFSMAIHNNCHFPENYNPPENCNSLAPPFFQFSIVKEKIPNPSELSLVSEFQKSNKFELCENLTQTKKIALCAKIFDCKKKKICENQHRSYRTHKNQKNETKKRALSS